MKGAFTQADRQDVIDRAMDGVRRPLGVFRKKARIVGVQAGADFTVETDRGVMEGKAGDWLVTNHPDDDPGSDLWSISDERMKATYEPAE